MAAQHVRLAWFYLRIFIISGLVIVLGTLLISAGWMAYTVSTPLNQPICCESPAAFGADFETMHFSTADGLKLSGWYIPPQNGTVIILIHSYFADRRQTMPVAKMLSKHGYGLLMYDQRASGESEGDTRSLGWRDIPDVSAAVGWLNARQKDLKIGAYGCSMGAAIALAGAAQQTSIQAVVLDAPSPLQWNENLPQISLQDPLSLPLMALYYPLVMLRTGSLPTTSTSEALQNYGIRPILFISSGQSAEFSRVNSYYQAAAGPKEHWNIPNALHCSGSITRPQEYEQHLLEFFNSTLH